MTKWTLLLMKKFMLFSLIFLGLTESYQSFHLNFTILLTLWYPHWQKSVAWSNERTKVVNFAITKPRSEHPWLIARIPSFIADFCSEVFRKRKKMLNLKDIIVKKITFHLNMYHESRHRWSFLTLQGGIYQG